MFGEECLLRESEYTCTYIVGDNSSRYPLGVLLFWMQCVEAKCATLIPIRTPRIHTLEAVATIPLVSLG